MKKNIKDELESALLDIPLLFESDTRTISIKKKYFVRTYRNIFYELLKDNKYIDDPKVLERLQYQIEDWTLNFNEKNTMVTAPNVMLMLTKNNLPTTKEFLRGKYKLDQIGRLEIIEKEKKSPF